MELLQDHFSADDIRLISNIPLSDVHQDDIMVWGGEPKGEYSVRSGYRQLIRPMVISSHFTPIFKQLWSVNCPAKIKILAWRFLKNFIPTNQNLYNRRVAHSPICPRCHSYTETIEHTVRDCSFVRAIWNLAGFAWPTDLINECFFDWFCWIFAHSSTTKRLEFLILLWAIWTSRNKLVRNNVKQDESTVVNFSLNYSREITSVSSSLLVPQNPMLANWTRPTEPFVKINVDAAFNASLGRASSGVVVRDSNGLVLGSCFIPTLNVLSPFAAEALAALHGLRFPLDLGCMHVVLESDSLTIISKLRSVVDDLSILRSYIVDARLVSQAFASCQFAFTPRSGNEVAHCLAHLGQDSAVEMFWVEEVPPQASALVQADHRCSERP
ncbi:hypothetical protein GQ457_03G016400 [Hibiscus cannabinus]